jgi:hypothetical protein
MGGMEMRIVLAIVTETVKLVPEQVRVMELVLMQVIVLALVRVIVLKRVRV